MSNFPSRDQWYSLENIYTSSVFCYDKHKKKFNIHFSKK